MMTRLILKKLYQTETVTPASLNLTLSLCTLEVSICFTIFGRHVQAFHGFPEQLDVLCFACVPAAVTTSKVHQIIQVIQILNLGHVGMTQGPRKQKPIMQKKEAHSAPGPVAAL